VQCKSDVDDIFEQVMRRVPVLFIEIFDFLHTKLPDGLYPIHHVLLNIQNDTRLPLAFQGYSSQTFDRGGSP